MIVFEKFIETVHGSILAANQSVNRANISNLLNYFEGTEEVENLLKEVKYLQEKAANITSKKDGRTIHQKIKELSERIHQLGMGGFLGSGFHPDMLIDENNEAETEDMELPEEHEAQKKEPLNFASLGQLRAKTVDIEYWENTEQGLAPRIVKVPLITLAPVAMTKVSEFKLKTKLELQEKNGKVEIGFVPTGTSDKETTNTSNHLGEIEITIVPDTPSNGLRKIIEGYEKILRSQIPH